jgi:hypothetical protein
VRTRGHLKVCALNNANSDKCGTRVSNGPVAFAQLRFQIPAMSRTASCSEAKPPEMNIRQSSAPLNFPIYSARANSLTGKQQELFA